MRILITNTSLIYRAGSELFVRDVALELLKRGHTPILYSPRLGEVAEEIRRATVPVTNDLHSVSVNPDIIHGQHHLETMTALSHFPNVPAVFFCHGMLPWEEIPPRHPRIMRYVAISEALRDRMTHEYAIPEQIISMFSGFVDMDKFKPRSVPLPEKPRKALIFSNYADRNNYVEIVRQACKQHGMSLDVIGRNYDTAVRSPESIIGQYDIIFARGRSALEGIAVGAAVICCDIEGLGAMITSENLAWFRRNNFGLRALNRPIQAGFLSEEISRYSALDAQKVACSVREQAGLKSAVDSILEIYQSGLHAWQEFQKAKRDDNSEGKAVAAYLNWVSKSVPNLSVQNSELRLQLDGIERSLIWRMRERCINWKPVIKTYLFAMSLFRRLRRNHAGSIQ